MHTYVRLRHAPCIIRDTICVYVCCMYVQCLHVCGNMWIYGYIDIFGIVRCGIVSFITYRNFTKIHLDDNVLYANNYPWSVHYAFFTLPLAIITHTDEVDWRCHYFNVDEDAYCIMYNGAAYMHTWALSFKLANAKIIYSGMYFISYVYNV